MADHGCRSIGARSGRGRTGPIDLGPACAQLAGDDVAGQVVALFDAGKMVDPHVAGECAVHGGHGVGLQ